MTTYGFITTKNNIVDVKAHSAKEGFRKAIIDFTITNQTLKKFRVIDETEFKVADVIEKVTKRYHTYNNKGYISRDEIGNKQIVFSVDDVNSLKKRIKKLELEIENATANSMHDNQIRGFLDESEAEIENLKYIL